MGAVAAAAGVALHAASLGDRFGPAPELVGGAGVAAVALAAAARRRAGIPVGLLLLGAAYAVALEGRGDTVDGGAVLVAPALMLAAELAYRATEAAPAPAETTLLAGDASVLAVLLGASLLAASLVLTTTAVHVPAHATLVGAGVVAATGALGLAARLARR